ncbi:MAG: muconolactone Delta-isomerase family protein [Candidatus Aminicenantaceae bacterium]
MLILFKGEVKEILPVPQEKFFEIATQQVQTLMDYKQQGKILAGGIMAGRKGSYAIFDVESIEELQGLLAKLPMFPFGENELIPLISYEKALETTKKLASK